MDLKLNNSGRAVFFLTTLLLQGTIDMMQFFGSTAGKISPLNVEGTDSIVFILVVLVYVVIACNCVSP